jgi:condensin complex subunit 1
VQPCRSKERFSLAEHVINTVYALGEHPDVPSDDLIKKLIFKAFSKRQKSPMPTQPEIANQEKDLDAVDEDELWEPLQGENGAQTLSQQAQQEGRRRCVRAESTSVRGWSCRHQADRIPRGSSW